MARNSMTGTRASTFESNNRGFLRGGVPSAYAMPRLALIGAVLLLVLIGIVMVFSASTVEAINNGDSPASYVVKQALFSIVGGALAAFISFRDYRSLRGGAWFWAFWGICVALLVAVPIIGRNILGATRWIYIGPFSIQPTEFAKIMLLAAGARVMADYREEMVDRKQALVTAAVLVILPLVLLYKTQSDMGSAVIILLGLFAVMWLAEVPWWHVALVALGVVAVGAFFGLTGYRSARIAVWLDPWSDQYNTGYQMIRSFYAFSEGGIFGVGLGNSREKFLYLPEAETDFIFSIIGEECGLVGTLAVIALFIVVLFCGVQIARQASDTFGKVLAGGLTAMLVGQAFLNMACATGLFPTTGKPLPFVSSGGSSVVASLIMVGILLSVSRASALESSFPRNDAAERRRANLSYIRVEDEPAYENDRSADRRDRRGSSRARFSAADDSQLSRTPASSRRYRDLELGGSSISSREGDRRESRRGTSRDSGYSNRDYRRGGGRGSR